MESFSQNMLMDECEDTNYNFHYTKIISHDSHRIQKEIFHISTCVSITCKKSATFWCFFCILCRCFGIEHAYVEFFLDNSVTF